MGAVTDFRADEPPRRADFRMYNRPLSICYRQKFMEAEQLNSIAAHLDDLDQRIGELRRYL